MEIDRGSPPLDPRPDSAEAAAALRQIGQDRAAIAHLPVPGWYFPAVAALLAAVMLGQLLPFPGSVIVSLASAAGSAAVLRVYVDKVGVLSWLAPRQVLPVVAVIIVVALGAAVLDGVYGGPWAWTAAAVVNAVAVLAFGAYYRRLSHDRR